MLDHALPETKLAVSRALAVSPTGDKLYDVNGEYGRGNGHFLIAQVKLPYLKQTLLDVVTFRRRFDYLARRGVILSYG